MPTAGDIVVDALERSGIVGMGQVAGGMEKARGLTDLADMLALWNEKRWLVWHTLDLAFVSTGVQEYSVGPGGNFNVTPRPAKIEAAFFRQLPGGTPWSPGFSPGFGPSALAIDYPVEIIPSREQYNRIALKQLISFGYYIFYDPSSPLGFVYPWPILNAGIYELHLTLKDVYPLVFDATTDFSSMPPFVIPAMKFNLAQWTRQRYGKGLKDDPKLNEMAQDALATVRNAHAAIPELVMPIQVVRAPAQRYNVFSDQQY
jgi:hypothetical protein